MICRLRNFVNFLPSSNKQNTNFSLNNENEKSFLLEKSDPALKNIVPWDSNKAYDVRIIIKRLVDNEDYFELMPHYAQNISIGFGRMAGQTVGIVANNPLISSGVLDIPSSVKAARFVR